MKKLSLRQLIDLLDDKKKQVCVDFLKTNTVQLRTLPGSVKKHQAWEGGLQDHIVEVMNIAYLLYLAMDKKRKLPFSLGDALFLLFFHDFDKLERYKIIDGEVGAEKYKSSADRIKQVLNDEYSYNLTQDEYNAFKYTHGEGDDYSEEKVMNELAAFVHCCDTISARIWYGYGEDKENW